MSTREEIVENLLKVALSPENNKKRNFKQSVEIYLRFRELDLKKPENRFTTTVELPNFPQSKENKIAVITEGPLLSAARGLGVATITRQQVESVSGNKKAARKLIAPYDFIISEAPLMPLVGKVLGSFLGPKDRMPTPVPPNLDIAPLVSRLRRSTLIRLKSQNAISSFVGTEDMPLNELRQNCMKILELVEQRIPNGLRNLDSITIKTTMGRPASHKMWVRQK